MNRNRCRIHMLTLSFLVCICQPVPAEELQTQFVQVHPVPGNASFRRTPGQERAVIVVHGMRLGPWRLKKGVEVHPIRLPNLLYWQEPGSPTVKTLAGEGDVFAFAFGQDVSVDEVSRAPLLATKIQELRKAGYKAVVLLGYSAGGVVCRQFVEDFPDAGVTKFVQICTPNGGTSWAKAQAAIAPPAQKKFFESLSPEARQESLRLRAAKKIPSKVEFVCLIADGPLRSDGLLLWDSIWTTDLQNQGVPIHKVSGVNHSNIITTRKGLDVICALIREPQPRWNPQEVDRVRKTLFGK